MCVYVYVCVCVCVYMMIVCVCVCVGIHVCVEEKVCQGSFIYVGTGVHVWLRRHPQSCLAMTSCSSLRYQPKLML